MKAIIVAGGRGERLRPLTNKLPKPMIQVGGKPILEHIIQLFKKNGIRKIILALCYLPEPIIKYFGDGSKFGVEINYTFEDPTIPLGTAGAILPAKKFITSTFIVTYADILRELDIKEMIKVHKNGKCIATMNVYKHSGSNFKSLIEFTQTNYLTRFSEFKKTKVLPRGYRWSNGSFYILEPQIFEFIPTDRKSDFSYDIFKKLLKQNKMIKVYKTEESLLDIGTKDSLKLAQKKFK